MDEKNIFLKEKQAPQNLILVSSHNTRIASKFETAKVMLFQSQYYRGNCFSSKMTGMM